MNQRLLIIIAVMLLVVGGVGLLLIGDEEPHKASVTTVEVYTVTKTIKSGEPFSADNYSKQSRQVEGSGAEKIDNMPPELSGYLATRDLEPGVTITHQDIQLKPTETVFLQKGFFIYQFPVQASDLAQTTNLTKGDRVDVWLRYFLTKKGQGGNHYELVNRKGQAIDHTSAEYVKVLSNRRFFSLSKSKSLEHISEGLSEKVVQPTLELEIENADALKVQAVGHLGEWVILPAHLSPEVVKNNTAIHGMVNELRGKAR